MTTNLTSHSTVEDVAYTGTLDVAVPGGIAATVATLTPIDAYINPYPFTGFEVTSAANNGTAWDSLTPATREIRVTIRNQATDKHLKVASNLIHKAPDVTTVTATHPAVSEAESYALINELISDFNTHSGSFTYHKTNQAAVSVDTASDEATLVAAANAFRTALLAHLNGTSTYHYGGAEVTIVAAVTATVAATDAASAITLENALYTQYAAHILLTSNGAHEIIPAGQALVWEIPNVSFWLQLESNGTYSYKAETITP